MSKLTREGKIEIYERRKKVETISSLAKFFNVYKFTINYLIALIKKHGYNILRNGKNILYRVNLKYKKENESEKIDIDLYKADILKNDSYETTIEKFKKINLGNESYIKTLDKLGKVSRWLFTYPEQESNFLKTNNEVMDVKVFETILKH